MRVYFRFPQQYVAVLNLFLIVLIAYSLAMAVSNGIKLHLVKNEVSSLSEPSGRKPLVRPEAALQPRAYYDTIVQRDIFSLAPLAPAAPPVEDQNLNITLIGTSHLSVGKPFIIVETTDGEQSLYRQGETIPSAGRVLSIGRNQAIVLHNGHRVVLKIPNPGEGGTSEPAPGLPQAPFRLHPRHFFGPPRHHGRHGQVLRFGVMNGESGVHKLGSNRYLIGRATVDSNLSNMGSLFTQIRAAPNLQNGASNGFRLSQIQAGSIFQQIGLQDGDILTGAQGQPVTNPLRAMALLNALRNSPSISLSVIRNGSPMQLNYTIR